MEVSRALARGSYFTVSAFTFSAPGIAFQATTAYLLSGVSQPECVPDGMFFMNASTAWIWPL
jgi:hypothetical protein